jgi:hypothetical protein
VSAFQRLKDLLLDDERNGRLRAEQLAAERLDALERRRLQPEELPALIDAAARGAAAPRLASALAAPVAHALGDAVVSRRQLIVDALFPVIGPAIRKAIAEALRGMVSDLNSAIESSLTPRGLRWRLEAWRTGAPYAQIVLRHTLRWRIEHLFLIEPGSGLVIHRESAPGLPDLDSDAIAGMLTAIGDFVHDSVGGGDGATLGSANVGEHLLWVEDGPRARLASFIRGAPPAALRELLRRRLEQIHERFADPLAQLQAGAADIGAALDQALDLPGVERDARALDSDPPQRRARWPAWLLFAVLLAVLAAWLVDQWRWARRIDAVGATLREWPGLVVQRVDRDGGTLTVRGLLDPLADPPAPALATLLPAGTPVRLVTRGYIATDPAIVERRARAVLGPPDGVAMQVVGARIVLAGELPQAARDLLLVRAALVPGVVAVDGAGLTAREAIQQTEIERLVAQAESIQLAFDGDAAEPTDERAVDALVEVLGRLRAVVAPQGRSLALRAWGATDDSGTPARNAALRAARARWLADRLSGTLKIDVAMAAADDARATLAARAAGVHVSIREARQP